MTIIVSVGTPKSVSQGDVWFDPTTKKSHQYVTSQAWTSGAWIPFTTTKLSHQPPRKGDVILDVLTQIPVLWDGSSWISALPSNYAWPPNPPTPGDIWMEPLSQMLYMFVNGTWMDLNNFAINAANMMTSSTAIPTAPTGTTSTTNTAAVVGNVLTIFGAHQDILVEIDGNGHLTYGPNYAPDAAAQIFWKALAGANPRKLQTDITALKELLKEATSKLAVAEHQLQQLAAAGHAPPTPPEPFDPDKAWERAMGVI